MILRRKKHHSVDSTDLTPLDNNSRGGYRQRIGIQKTIASRAGLRAAQEFQPRPTEGRPSLGAIASPSPSARPLLSFEGAANSARRAAAAVAMGRLPGNVTFSEDLSDPGVHHTFMRLTLLLGR